MLKLKHALILTDIAEDGKGRIYCPIPEQLTEDELCVVKTLIAEAAKNPEIFNGYEPGRYEVKFTKMNPLTRNVKVELTPM